MRLALRLVLLLAIAAHAMGKGAGAWLDAHHYKPGSFAGLRFIAEDPPHVLNVVGTDDGVGAPPRTARATAAIFDRRLMPPTRRSHRARAAAILTTSSCHAQTGGTSREPAAAKA